MPAYNCENYIRQAIESILNQTYSNIELLIADDCSKDRTKAIIDSYTDPRIKTFHNDTNLGYLKASNKLFRKCSGDLISFQDADDYSDITRFEKISDFLFSNPETDCVGSNVAKIDPDGIEFNQSNFPLTDSEIRKSFENYNVVFTGSALTIKKRVIEKTGIYNEYFDRIGAEDIYLYSHILDHFKVANLKDKLYYYRANPQSVTSTHKNPKAFVTGDLSIKYYKNRRSGKKDHILSGEWKKADVFASYMIALKQPYTLTSVFVKTFLNECVKAPWAIPEFFREFLSKLKFRLTH